MNDEEFILKFYSCDNEEQFLKDVNHNLNCLQKLQNNWNELKNYLEKQIIDSKPASSQQYYFNTIYKLMQELEQGSDSE